MSKTAPLKNLYGGIRVLSPDGAIIFRCNTKKAEWYLRKGLAETISEDVIMLLFKPKGLGSADDPYMLSEKKNICVVCGADDGLTRHHIVPRCYRSCFPTHFKTHLSHDVLLLCVPCHEKYELSSQKRQAKLARKYAVPEPGKERKITLGRRGMTALSSAVALLDAKNHIPEDRKQVLWSRVEQFMGRRPSKEELTEFVESVKECPNHGQMLIAKLLGDGESLEAFVKSWRGHFIKLLKPKFLPKGWAISSKTHHSESDGKIFHAQINAFKKGAEDASKGLSPRPPFGVESWIKEAYEIGYSKSKKS